jgi:hypothetical protein
VFEEILQKLLVGRSAIWYEMQWHMAVLLGVTPIEKLKVEEFMTLYQNIVKVRGPLEFGRLPPVMTRR